ncbi:EAL domain-containing protein [Motiliproteus sp. MSK22-1]|uniref:EAL domain-containing protein n=1 Tax=Motiliproteus sp. MSK22-1 TaxID=1897630 RepID=UPI00097858C8|nr:EAL domain-containing protein [Motiliproteus sp. MSK22-1]OMH32134.1 hypothetical protein BGP75_15665 [Motiliproteus sp. MSK22-1]
MIFKHSKSISSIVQRQVITCSPDLPLIDASKLMREHACSSIIVVQDEIPIGIWTEGDSLKIDYGASDLLSTEISQLMSSPLSSISNELSLDEAAHEFKLRGVRHLGVLDSEGKLFGILSQSDVVRHQDTEYFLHMNEVESILPTSKPLEIDHYCTLPQAVHQMRINRADAIVVVNKNTPVGLLTERDLVRLIAHNRMHLSLTEVMSKPLLCVPRSMTLLAARSLMDRRHIRHLGITDNEGALLGLISFSNILANIEDAYVNRLKSALVRRAADLQRSEHSLSMAHALIDASMDGIMVTDQKGVIQSVNPAFSVLTGYSEREALGQNASLISSGKQGPEFYSRMWNQIKETGTWQGEIWNRRKSGEVFPEWLTITAIKDHENKRMLYAGIFSDITERKRSEAIIENLAYYDPLTRLPNRQLLFDRLEVALATAHRDKHGLAIIFIDLDHFKRINDTLGHTAGDQVLCKVAKRLLSCVREGDTVSRIGGDEIVLLLTEIDNTNVVHRIVQRAFDMLERSIELEDRELYITASMGCSIYPDDGTDRDTLMKNADTAMYRAKHAGRNGFQLYSAEMNAKSMQRLSMESRLRVALLNNEFFIHYQPKLALSDNRIIGVEALLRWRDKDLGLVPPDEFIPLAEDLGLIGDIGAWVLKETCQQCRSWINLGHAPIQVSVNVSAHQFKRRKLEDDVQLALESAKLPPQFLDLEITESCLIEDADTVANTLKKLRSQGISISMDDFGTGYSSLSLLKRIPLDHLKIDRSFMEGIPEDINDMELVSTIILMAHNLGLKTVAEGVENNDQLNYLRKLGCDQIQGFYFSRPLDPENLTELLNATIS